VNNKKSELLDISVILATFNRANDLSRTLEKLAQTDRGDLLVNFVIVDNGSTDKTKEIINSFLNRIRIKYLFEPRNGKNIALNTALNSCELGKIVVFIDDDVDVDRDWLTAISTICERWPNHEVFGGKIEVIFPVKKVPQWAKDPFISSFNFARHDYSKYECIYDSRHAPFGPNYWVRSSVFNNKRRFNEIVGPRQKNRIMGSESTFLFQLVKEGYQIVYSPKAIVKHRVQKRNMYLIEMLKRAYRQGRGQAYYFGKPILIPENLGYSRILDQMQLNNKNRIDRLKRNYLINYYYLFIKFQLIEVVKALIYLKNGNKITVIPKRLIELGQLIESIKFYKR
jgi:L-malate glycosyltransferase